MGGKAQDICGQEIFSDLPAPMHVVFTSNEPYGNRSWYAEMVKYQHRNGTKNNLHDHL